jgi:hypothetical protein
MSSAAAASAAVGSADLQTVLLAPLSLVQRALDTHAAQHPAAATAATSNAALQHADVQSLHSHLSSSNWGVEEALHQLLGLQHKRSDPQCKIAMVRARHAHSTAGNDECSQSSA